MTWLLEFVARVCSKSKKGGIFTVVLMSVTAIFLLAVVFAEFLAETAFNKIPEELRRRAEWGNKD